MNKTSSSQRRLPSRRWKQIAAVLLLIILAGVLLLPWLLAGTSLRNQLFSALLADPGVEVTSKGASFGYFSPLSIDGLHVHQREGGTDLQVERIVADKSWPAMLWQRPDLGTFTFIRPNVDVVFKQKPPSKESQSAAVAHKPFKPEATLPALQAVIDHARIRVRGDQQDIPAVDLEDVNVIFHLQQSGDGSLLVVDPVTVFDRQPLTPQICRSGLHLVAPLLESQLDIEGEFTLELQRFRLPLGTTPSSSSRTALDIAGTVELHEAAISIRDSLAGAIIRLIDAFLEFPIPDKMNVIEESAIEFHVTDGRIHHRGFATVLPHGGDSIGLQTSGSVGMDRSLDLQIEISLPGQSTGKPTWGRWIGTTPLKLIAQGTLDKPVLKPVLQDGWVEPLQQVLDSGDILQRAAEAARQTRQTMGNLLDRQRMQNAPMLPRIKERWQHRRQRRRDHRKSSGDRGLEKNDDGST